MLIGFWCGPLKWHLSNRAVLSSFRLYKKTSPMELQALRRVRAEIQRSNRCVSFPRGCMQLSTTS